MQRLIDTYTAGLRSYLKGFALALLLTAIPFGLVAAGTLPAAVMMPSISAAAIIQILVHLHYFLHLDLTPRNQWYLVAILFTLLIIAIMVGGTLWILSDLSEHMMAP